MEIKTVLKAYAALWSMLTFPSSIGFLFDQFFLVRDTDNPWHSNQFMSVYALFQSIKVSWKILILVFVFMIIFH